MFYRFLKLRKKVVTINIQLCFSEKNNEQVQKLAGESFDISLFEIANAYYSKDKKSKNGIPIEYMPDQNMGDENTVFTPLFGIQISTITATSSLYKGGNTAVIPYSFIRTDNKYNISFSAPLENYPSGDLVADAKITNKILAKQIRKKPA